MVDVVDPLAHSRPEEGAWPGAGAEGMDFINDSLLINNISLITNRWCTRVGGAGRELLQSPGFSS